MGGGSPLSPPLYETMVCLSVCLFVCLPVCLLCITLLQRLLSVYSLLRVPLLVFFFADAANGNQ